MCFKNFTEGASHEEHQCELFGQPRSRGPHAVDRFGEPGDGRAAGHHGRGDKGRAAPCDQRRIRRSRRTAPRTRGTDI